MPRDGLLRCVRNDGWAACRGLACGIHARNMHTYIAPYSYGLAARARRIYNDVACSGGQGVRPSRQTLPLEATRPGLPEARWRFRRKRHLAQSTPGLVYSSAPPGPFHQRNHIGKTQTQHAVIGPVCRRSKRFEKLPDDRKRHYEHPMATADRAFGFARLKAMPAFDRQGARCRRWGHQPGAVVPGFQIHLKSGFCSEGGISVC
jgi:hypothetical protein